MIFSTLTGRTPTWKPLALASAVTLCTFHPAIAQTNDDKTLTPVVVTASRIEQALTDVLSDNIVITSEEIANSGQSSLVELLQRKRGIEISRNGGPGSTSTVFLRGANSNQTVVLIDGVRTGSATTGAASLEAIPLSQIDHIEIVYGPLSSIYGADAVGGVIQVFTKKGDGAPRLSASAGVGSYGARALDASVSGSTTNEEHRFRYAISASHETADGFSATKPGHPFSFNMDKDGYEKDSASGQFSLAVAKGHEVGLTFLQSKLNAQFDNGPGTFDNHSVSRLGSYALYSKNQLLPWWSSQVQVSQSTDKLDSFSPIDTYNPQEKTQFDTTQTGFSWQNNLTMGTDLLQLIVEQRKEKVDSTTMELIGDRTTNSFAASYQLKRGAHLASASARNDDNSDFGSSTTGSLAYGYRLTSALRANASIGTSFRAPSFNDLYYPRYGVASNKPEQGKNAELALHYDNGTTQLNAVYYRNRITDLLVLADPCPVESDTHPYGCTVNVNQATLRGLSLSGSTTMEQFTIRGSLDFLNPHNDTNDMILARRAKRHGSLALEYRSGAINTGVEMLFSGERFDDTKNKNKLSGYGLLNLYTSYDFAPSWSLFGRWNNVLDKDYELAKNYATAGSNVFVGVRYAMK